MSKFNAITTSQKRCCAHRKRLRHLKHILHHRAHCLVGIIFKWSAVTPFPLQAASYCVETQTCIQQSERKWIWGVVKIFYCTIHQWEINHRISIKVKYAFDSTARWESRERAEHSWNHKVDIETLQYALEYDAVDVAAEGRTNIRSHLLNRMAAGVWQRNQIVPCDASLPSSSSFVARRASQIETFNEWKN